MQNNPTVNSLAVLVTRPEYFFIHHYVFHLTCVMPIPENTKNVLKMSTVSPDASMQGDGDATDWWLQPQSNGQAFCIRLYTPEKENKNWTYGWYKFMIFWYFKNQQNTEVDDDGTVIEMVAMWPLTCMTRDCSASLRLKQVLSTYRQLRRKMRCREPPISIGRGSLSGHCRQSSAPVTLQAITDWLEVWL